MTKKRKSCVGLDLALAAYLRNLWAIGNFGLGGEVAWGLFGYVWLDSMWDPVLRWQNA